MAPGVTMAVIGAILAFAVRANPSGIDLQVVGVILLLAGGILIWHEYRGTSRERTVTRSQYPTGPHDLRGPLNKSRTVRRTSPDRDSE
jgi:hypothetical protein